MTQLHLHLILAHIPVVVIPFAAIILFVAILKDIDRYKILALALFVVSSAITLPIYFTGDSAEEVIEDSPLFSESIIEEHEESAEITLWLVSILGVLSLICIIFHNFEPLYYNSKFLSLILLLSMCTTVSLISTAGKGGEISHPEAFDKNYSGNLNKE